VLVAPVVYIAEPAVQHRDRPVFRNWRDSQLIARERLQAAALDPVARDGSWVRYAIVYDGAANSNGDTEPPRPHHHPHVLPRLEAFGGEQLPERLERKRPPTTCKLYIPLIPSEVTPDSESARRRPPSRMEGAGASRAIALR